MIYALDNVRGGLNLRLDVDAGLLYGEAEKFVLETDEQGKQEFRSSYRQGFGVGIVGGRHILVWGKEE